MEQNELCIEFTIDGVNYTIVWDGLQYILITGKIANHNRLYFPSLKAILYKMLTLAHASKKPKSVKEFTEGVTKSIAELEELAKSFERIFPAKLVAFGAKDA